MADYCTLKSFQRLRTNIRTLEKEVTDLQIAVQVALEETGNSWHDNAPYEMLLQDVHFKSSRLAQLRLHIGCLQIQEYPSNIIAPYVQYGCITNIVFDSSPFTYAIVGVGDENPDKNIISYLSPVARALLGKREGDSYSAKVNGSFRHIEIKSVSSLDEKILVHVNREV